MTLINKMMQELMEDMDNGNNKGNKIRVNSLDLLEIIWPEFVEIDGCILIQRPTDKTRQINLQFVLSQFGDRTGFEAFDSHTHMIDYGFLDNTIEGLRFGLTLMEIWECKLKRDFPNYEFLLILVHYEDDTIIRLHKYRPEEAAWLSMDDLDGYEDNAIVVKKI